MSTVAPAQQNPTSETQNSSIHEKVTTDNNQAPCLFYGIQIDFPAIVFYHRIDPSLARAPVS